MLALQRDCLSPETRWQHPQIFLEWASSFIWSPHFIFLASTAPCHSHWAGGVRGYHLPLNDSHLWGRAAFPHVLLIAILPRNRRVTAVILSTVCYLFLSKVFLYSDMFFKPEGPQHTHINLNGPTWIHESDVSFLKTHETLTQAESHWTPSVLAELLPTLFWSLTESNKHAASCRRAIRSLSRVLLPVGWLS